MSVCPHGKTFDSRGTDVPENWQWGYVLNFLGIFQFWFKSDMWHFYMEELYTVITTFVTNVKIDFKVARVTLFARFSSVHIISVITCVTDVAKLTVNLIFV